MKKTVLWLLVCAVMCSGAQAQSQPLFEPAGGVYNYCPSAFVEDGVTHVYYCTNTESEVIVDSIGYRTSENGAAYSEERIVLSPHESRWQWDGVHTCDPDVIKGEFHWDGEVYEYLMAYLGCKTHDCQENEIGLAVAKSPQGPFVKLTHLNPFVAYERDTSTAQMALTFQWGVGQPSLVSMDRMGQVMLIYTVGDQNRGNYLVCEKWDLSDLNTPLPIGENWKIQVTNSGAMGRDFRLYSVYNADFAYDSTQGYLYMVCDGAPLYIPGVDAPGEPTYVSSNLRVMRFSQRFDPADMACFFQEDDTASWQVVQLIRAGDTGYPRNHNACLAADPYGWLLPDEPLRVLYSVSQASDEVYTLWSFRIHEYLIYVNGKNT